MSYTKIHIKIIVVVISLGAIIIIATKKIELMNEVNGLRKIVSGLRSKSNSTSEIIMAEISAYTSRKIETDDTPCINAWGDNICNLHNAGIRIIACPARLNRLDLVEINGTQFRCLDRMNIRYREGNYFDIYFGKNLEGAKKFGRQTQEIKVYHQS